MPPDTAQPPRPSRIITPAVLLQAWQESRDSSAKPGAKGIDGLTGRQFNENRELQFSRIIEDIKRGSYSFSDLRPFFIPKKSGKLRVICVPTVKDRLVQRVMIEALTRKDRFHLLNPVSFGFIRGKGVRAAIDEAIDRRAKREWVLKTDIQSFFDTINRPQLKELVARRLRGHSLVPLLCDAIDCEVRAKTKTDRVRLQQLQIHPGRGLRQGMPLSPLLSNLVLAGFDRAAQSRGHDIMRYADDLILFGESKSQLEDGFTFLVQELKKVGHSVPAPGVDSKTEFIDPKKPVEFLGMEIVHKETLSRYVCRIPKAVRKRILSNIVSENTVETALRDKETFDGLCKRLSGLPSAYRSAFRQAEDWPNFEPEILQACNKALAQVFVSIFGSRAVDALPPAVRQFLGIVHIVPDS